MKQLFKKGLALLVALVVILSALTFSVAAAGANSTIAFSKKTLNIGETLTVTATFSTPSNEPMYAISGYVNYDPNVFEYIDSGSGCNLITKGKVKLILTVEGKTNFSKAIKFKALKAGKSTISLEQLQYANNSTEANMDGSAAPVTISNPSAQASSNANLKTLVVSSGTLTPKFDPNVTEYSITLKNDITELWVSTTKADAKASVTVEGSKDMKVGSNKRVVVVTAENGTTKRYTLNITRLAADGQQPVTPPENNEPLNDLIEVNVGEDIMYVVEDFGDTELPKGFEITEYALNGKTVPALTTDNYIVLMLRLPDNSKKAFYVYGDEGVFSELIGISIGGQTYYIIPTDKVPDGYSAVNDFTIGDIVVPAFRNDEAGFEDFAVVYAMGPTGATSYYSYDIVENTIQRISGVSVNVETQPSIGTTTPGEEEEEKDILTTLTDNFVSLNTNGKIVVITILAIILLLLVAIIVLIVKIATAGRRDDDYDDYEDDLEGNDDAIVGFDYVSTTNNAPQNEVESIPAEEPVVEETPVQEEPAEAEEEAEEEETEE